MPIATIECLTYVVGPGRSRIPRSPAAGAYPAGLGPIPCYPQQNPNTVVPGTPYTATYPPEQITCGGITYYFGFQNVTGLQGGGKISYDFMNPCSGTVQIDPIFVINIYFPAGGTGPGGQSGAAIDVWDIDHGCLRDDIFVTVSPDDSIHTLTNQANNLGWVPSSSKENATAYDHITPSNLYFKNWAILAFGDSSDTILDHVLTVGKGTNFYAFAFYVMPDKNHMLDTKPRSMDNYRAKEIAADIFHFPWDQGDPIYYQPAIDTLNEKLSILEKRVNELGKAFIRIQERPAVGKQISKGKKG